ncbi:hypothetical protein, conserved [Leishmania tarentolae]|uniref:Uncharacterized protein n=1 Tax=Leishmania tarentolae TaxID=5689 RepID=A0A640KNV5_LEITA|nr:hypothetical protein, conserved [Leishmania tarentolae]
MSTRVPHQVVEDRLLKAPRLPEALFEVVGLVCLSLVHNACDFSAAEVAAAAAAGGIPGADFEDAALMPPLPAQGAGSAVCGTHDTGNSAPSLSEEMQTACIGHTATGNAVSTADWDEWANIAVRSFFGECDTSLSKLPTMTRSAALPGVSPTTSSVQDSPSSTSCVPHPVPVVELSPLILRVLLWWAGRLQLPSRGSETAAKAVHQSTYSSRIHRHGVGDDQTSGLPDDSRATLYPSPSDDGCSSKFPLHQQDDVTSAQQLRLRIADIFTLLCRRDSGVVVSDALLYGRCHDASELAAQRCHLVFSGFSDARWRVATTLASTPPTPFATAMELVPMDSSASPDSEHDGAGAPSDMYNVSQVLCALVDLHTVVASATRHSQLSPSPNLTRVASVESDVVATGVLLRALLRCPRLHKRVMRLFSGDVRAAEPRRHRRGGSAVTVMPPPAKFLLHLEPTSSSTVVPNSATTERQLDIFLPALVHASPIVSAESWQTLTVLLFPSSTATVSSATRRLLLCTPDCPVQRLLAAALALPGDDDADTCVSRPSTPQHIVFPTSHPMARNNALRLLHVLCSSSDLPPGLQSLFHQCPALLWRVLRLAAAVCTGVAVAHTSLVRRVLVDYIMLCVPQSNCSESGDASLSNNSSVSTRALLHENKDALACFLASTHVAWGGSGIAPEDTGGELVGASALAAWESGYDEGHLMTVLKTL